MSILNSTCSGQLSVAQKELSKIYNENNHVCFRLETINGSVIATLWNNPSNLMYINNPINVDAMKLPCKIKFDGTPRVQFFFFTEKYQFKNIPTKEELEKQTSQYVFQGASFRPEMILDAYNFREHIQYSNIYLPEVFAYNNTFKPCIQEFEDRGIDTARFIKRIVANNNTVYILEDDIPDTIQFQRNLTPIQYREYQKITEDETTSIFWKQYITHCMKQEHKKYGFST